jgi:hypothetical protein
VTALYNRLHLSGSTVHMVAALLLALTALAGAWAGRKRSWLPVLWALFLDSMMVIALVTLVRVPGGGDATHWRLGRDIDPLEFAANLALYVLPGTFLALIPLKRRLLALLLLGLVVPSAVEFLQHHFDLGRIADVNDVLANGLGAVLGWTFGSALRLQRVTKTPTNTLQPVTP